MKNNDFKDFDISNFIELTEDQLRFEVNGGSRKSSSSSSHSSSSSSRGSSSSSRGSSSSSSRGSSSSSTSRPSSSNTRTTTSSSSAGKSSTKQSSGSHEVANTNHAVANAKPGDTITRNNGTKVTLTQGDINYAKAHDNTPVAAPTDKTQISSQADSTTSNTGSNTTRSSGSSSSSSNGSTGYSSGSSPSLQATMNATRHDPDYREQQNKGTAIPVDARHPAGEMTAGEKQAYVHDPDFRFGKNTAVKRSDSYSILKKIKTFLFSNDSSEKVFTKGISLSGTVTSTSGACSAGVYINPKNDNLYRLSEAMVMRGDAFSMIGGYIIQAFNIEEMGLYIGTEAGFGVGVSGSISASFGNCKSLDDLQGGYVDAGISGGKVVSLGGDFIFNKQGEVVGSATSIGAGVGSPFEGHVRAGITGTLPLIKSKEK